jgi:hypothetical protein
VSGLVAFDVDGDTGEEELLRIFKGDIPQTLGFRSGRGGRRIFLRLPPGVAYPRPVLGVNRAKLDFLSVGSQTVMPPSAHASGALYEWVYGWHPERPLIVEATPELLAAVERARGKRSLPGGGARGPALAIDDQARQVVRARADILTWDVCVSGQGGDKTIFNKCCRLIHGYELSVETAFALMNEGWNQRCEPPWSDAELRHHLEGARDRGSHPRIEHKPYHHPRPEQTMPKRSNRRQQSADGAGCPSPQVSVDGGNGMQADADKRTHYISDVGNSDRPQPCPQTPSDTPRTPDAPAPAKQYGRLGSTLKRRKPTYFIRPWLPARMLSLIIGAGNSGKSHALAWMLAQAKRPVLFPGYEEDVEGDLLGRLGAAGVDLDNLLIVDKEPLYLFSDAHKLATILRQHKADLVAFDPLDSYIHQEGRENDNPTVRKALEELCRVMGDANATAIGIRHPGKQRGNLVRGAAAWRNVPRVAVELRWDRIADKRTLLVDKYPWGPVPPAQHFRISGPKGAPAKFELIGSADEGMLRMEEEVPDRLGQSKHLEARRFLRSELAEGPQPANQIFHRGKAIDLSPDTLRRAADLDGVERPEPEKRGPGAVWLWVPPKRWPPLDQ